MYASLPFLFPILTMCSIFVVHLLLTVCLCVYLCSIVCALVPLSTKCVLYNRVYVSCMRRCNTSVKNVCRLASWLNTVRGPAPDAIDSFACVVTPRVLSTTTTTYVCVSPLLVDRRLNDVVRRDEVVRGYRQSRRFLWYPETELAVSVRPDMIFAKQRRFLGSIHASRPRTRPNALVCSVSFVGSFSGNVSQRSSKNVDRNKLQDLFNSEVSRSYWALSLIFE